MLPKKLHLPIQNFPKSAKVVFSDTNITIKEAKNGLPNSRLGVLVSKQVSKSSAVRNSLRRKFLNFPKSLLVNEKGGKDLLIILKPPIIKLTKEEINEEVQNYEQFI
jgi:ribonuclease P protein component